MFSPLSPRGGEGRVRGLEIPIRKQNILYVYADEWLSARLDKELGNSVVTVHTHRVRDWYNELFPKPSLLRVIKFGSDPVLISDEVHCQSLSASLGRLNIVYEVETIGDYKVYHDFEVPKIGTDTFFQEKVSVPFSGSLPYGDRGKKVAVPRYYWTGFNVLKYENDSN